MSRCSDLKSAREDRSAAPLFKNNMADNEQNNDFTFISENDCNYFIELFLKGCGMGQAWNGEGRAPVIRKRTSPTRIIT